MSERLLTQQEIDAAVEKTRAEAEVYVQEAHKHAAEARHFDVMNEHVAALVQHTKLEARMQAISLAKMEREESFARVSNLYNHVYHFDDEVNDASVSRCINTLQAWSRQDPKCEIEIVINSPGGDIMPGFALIDFILNLRSKGHKINTLALGVAASMGAVILQAGDVRAMGPNAMILLHEGSMGAIGSYAEVTDRVKLVEKLHGRIWELFASRAQPLNSHTTVAVLKKLAQRTDVWLTSNEALKMGLVDIVQ